MARVEAIQSSNSRFTPRISNLHTCLSMVPSQLGSNMPTSRRRSCDTVPCMLTQRSSSARSGTLHVAKCARDDNESLGFARYDAHPMSMLTSAFAMLGSYYSEANPSLQGPPQTLCLCLAIVHDLFSGQKLYTQGDKESIAIMDRQIYRLIGKATTLAAYARLA